MPNGLKIFAVGDYDVVLAADEAGARVVYEDIYGKGSMVIDELTGDENEISELVANTDEIVLTFEDRTTMTLTEYVKTKTEPCYLYGIE